MDFPNEDLSMRNHIKQEDDNDYIITSKQRNQGDEVENVFTSTSSQTASSFVPVNGSRIKNEESSALQSNTRDNVSECSQPQTLNSESNHCSNILNTETPSCSNIVLNSTDNDQTSNIEKQNCQRHKVCMDKSVNNYCNVNMPSTSGTSRSYEICENSCLRENRKRPSTLKLNRLNLETADSSSDTGNDDYSLGSEDGCIYTYRGGEHLADLPSSFFSLDMGLPLDRYLPLPPIYSVSQQGAVNAREHGSRACSPDMDFLEMDFDPGPSCEADTGDESIPNDLQLSAVLEECEQDIEEISPEYLSDSIHIPQPSVSASKSELPNNELNHHVPSTSYEVDEPTNVTLENMAGNQEYGPYITYINFRGEQLLVRRTMSTNTFQTDTSANLHASNGDLVSSREILNYKEQPEGSHTYQINQGERPTLNSANLSSALYHTTMAKKLMTEKTQSEEESFDSANMDTTPRDDNETRCVEPPCCMVWSEKEACERQVTQIATSACGATAVVNVFNALGVPVNIEKINTAVGTRQRAEYSPLARYLLSRAVAGCTAADLVTGIQRASEGVVTARFFPTYPERVFSLSHWLADWISLGAVPILTLNLQVGRDEEIPDAWHHQMVFGVSPRGIYLCNPVECISETALWPRLTSPSELLVRTRDIVLRLSHHTDLTPLMVVPDRRFHTLNVLGQVVNVIREWRSCGWSERGTRTRHVRMPAAYTAGVTVSALTGSEAHRRLVHTPLPPLAHAPDTDMDVMESKSDV